MQSSTRAPELETPFPSPTVCQFCGLTLHPRNQSGHCRACRKEKSATHLAPRPALCPGWVVRDGAYAICGESFDNGGAYTQGHDECIRRRNKAKTSGHELGDLYNLKIQGGRITGETLEQCRRDLAWEARNGILDYVACRKCGALVRSPMGDARGHLRTRHQGMTPDEYRLDFPDAPLRPFAGRVGGSPEELARECLEDYVTPDERDACMRDVAWEARKGIVDFMVCRLCAFKSRSWLGNHLKAVHSGMTTKKYQEQFPGALLCSFAMSAARPTAASSAEQIAAEFADRWLDPAKLPIAADYEARDGMDDRVICRECGQVFRHRIPSEHLAIHRLNGITYRAKHPGAPLGSAKNLQAQRQRVQKMRAPKKRGRSRDKETPNRILLAAKLASEEVSQRQAACQIFPNLSHNPDQAYSNTRQFYSQYRAEIDAEINRLRESKTPVANSRQFTTR